MENLTNTHEEIITEYRELSVTRRRSLRKLILNPLVCSVATAIGIFGGISSLIAGVMCIVIHAIVPADHLFDRVGTALLILGVPMLLIGSVFLDEIEIKK